MWLQKYEIKTIPPKNLIALLRIIAELLLFLPPHNKKSEKNKVGMEYMSQEGYDKLVAELHELESVELPKVREAIAEARDKGDLSENFEYHAAKREQARLLSRIRFKERVLEFARVIDTSRLGSEKV